MPPSGKNGGPPSRYSQTLLSKADNCPHSAYLYREARPAPNSHPKLRGIAVHEVLDRLITTLIEQAEPALHDGTDRDKAMIASMTQAIVDEVRDERPDLCLPAADWDDVREMAFHAGVGLDVNPEHVLGIEQAFILDTPHGPVVGRVDLLCQPEPGVLHIDDYKSGFGFPSQEDYERAFQPRLYAALVLFGEPVEFTDDDQEQRGFPVATGVQHIRTREIYPRRLTGDGRMFSRERWLSRGEVMEFRRDVEALVKRTRERFVSEGDPVDVFPAVPGSHCGVCPAPARCPVPVDLRDFEGGVEDAVGAGVLGVEWGALERRQQRVKRALRGWAEVHGSVPVGVDVELALVPREFVDDRGRRRVSVEFRKRKIQKGRDAA